MKKLNQVALLELRRDQRVIVTECGVMFGEEGRGSSQQAASESEPSHTDPDLAP